MKIIKRILVAAGTAFIALILFAVAVDKKAENFSDHNKDFIVTFVSDLTEFWRFSDVESMVSDQFIDQVSATEAQSALKEFKSFGSLVAITHLEMVDYMFFVNSKGDLGVFSVRAKFEHGDAIVQIVLESSDDTVRVQSLNIEPIFNHSSKSIASSI